MLIQIQAKPLHICFKSTSPKFLDLFLLRWSLSLLKLLGSVFFEWSITEKFLVLFISWRCKFTPNPFSFKFALSVHTIILTLSSWEPLFNIFTKSAIDFAINSDDLSVLKPIVPKNKIKWSGPSRNEVLIC